MMYLIAAILTYGYTPNIPCKAGQVSVHRDSEPWITYCLAKGEDLDDDDGIYRMSADDIEKGWMYAR